MNILFEIEWNCLGVEGLFKKRYFDENDDISFLFLPNSATAEYIRFIKHERVKKYRLDYDTMENPIKRTIEKILPDIDKIVFVSWKDHKNSLFYESVEPLREKIPIDVFVLN